MNHEQIASMRKNYSQRTLSEKDVKKNPFEQFKQWFEEAVSSQLLEPNAMTIATASKKGKPSARTVLLKGFDERGFVFYTNYESRKGDELISNPQAAILFNWLELERQIRIEGKVEKIATEESEAYFVSRPKGSQLGAWASPQSQVIKSRTIIEDNLINLEAQFAKSEVLPLPDFWGGFRVIPDYFEFWQGRSNRLHDRLSYSLKRKNWGIERLAP
jgi:pyridoxamine 5'-phosphate oxidase